MNCTVPEVLQYVRENDVKFIRLAFCDIFGTLKNISIMPSELPRAFESGISFDASAVKGFLNVEEGDLFLFPDPSTLSVLPWRPQQGRVIRMYCAIRHHDGSPFSGDGRQILQNVLEKAGSMGLGCQVGPECEFYLFLQDERGNPTDRPHDSAGYLDVAPLDRGENVRREICLTLEEMGIGPESSHHEQGPGQNEVDFKYSDALGAADNLVTFKTVVKTVAEHYGLYASFMPKPLYGKSGSGLHVNLSLSRGGLNIFRVTPYEHSRDAESFIAGVMGRIRECTAFLNPLTNSYARFGSCEAPRYVTWSRQNRSQLVRIPAEEGEHARMELRSPDPSCNPYLAFALLIAAGLEGIENKTALPPPADFRILEEGGSGAGGYDSLPADLGEALALARGSRWLQSTLPEDMVCKYLQYKEHEWEQYRQAEDKEAMDRALYFISV